MTYLYMYRLTSDTGLAPCIDNNMLSLACCKGGQIRNGKPVNTGLRFRIGSKKECDYKKDDVYILGTYKNKFLYLARITDIVLMTEYYKDMCKGRMDRIYSYKDGKLERNNHLRQEDVHTDPLVNIRDLAGEYVLISKDYIYLGKDAVLLPLINEKGAKYRETVPYYGEEAEMIINECRKADDGKSHNPNNPFKSKCGGCK